MAKAAAKRSFRYTERSREDVRERANMRGGSFDSYIKSKFKRYKVRDGKNLVRIMPPTWDGAKHYGFDIHVNYGIGVDNQSYLSISKMKQLYPDLEALESAKDPIAEARREAEAEGDEKTAKALQPRHRILMWVIDRLDEDEGPQLWDAPFTLDKDFCNLSLDEDTKEAIFVDDPEEGCDIRFYKEGTGMTTKYPASKMKLMSKSPIHEDEKLQEGWLEFITENPVPDCLEYHDYAHISEVFDGHVRVDKDEDDDKPARSKRSRDSEDEDEPKPRRRAALKAEPDEDEDEPEEKPKRRRSEPDEDDEPEEKPKRRAKVEVDPDEDEPEEKPKRRRVAAEPDEDEDEPEEKPRQSIRDKLKQRRAAVSSKSEDDDD